MDRPLPNRIRLAALIGAATMAATVAGSAPARASDDSWGASYTPDSTDARLVPGGSTRGTLRLVNHQAGALQVKLAATEIVDDENGCLAPERRTPLEDCGVTGAVGTGELSSQVLLTIGSEAARPLREAGAGPLVVKAGEEIDLPVVWTLPEASTNETMTDGVEVTFRARAGRQSEEVVLGAAGESASGGDGSVASGASAAATDDLGAMTDAVTDLLPSTGTPVRWVLLVLGAGLVGVGSLVIVAGRRRRT